MANGNDKIILENALKSYPVIDFLLSHKCLCPSCFLFFLQQAVICSLFNILCTLSVPHTSLLHGLSWETFPSIIQILHLQLGLHHLSCAKVSISHKCVKQIPSCLGHLVKHGSVGKRLEIVYPIPRGAAPIPGLGVDLWVCSLIFFSHELLNILHFLTL